MTLTPLRVSLSRLWGLFSNRRAERELAEEIRNHLDLLTEENLRLGLPEAEARNAARRAFGGVEQIREVHRDQRRFSFADASLRDLRYAVRLLTKDKTFTAVAVVTLALGIGVNTAMYSILNAVVFRGLPVEHPEKIVGFTNDSRPLQVSPKILREWRSQAKTFEGLAGYASGSMTLSETDRAPERFTGAYLSANAFSLLEVKPILGRDFRIEDESPGAIPVVILGNKIWSSRYDKSASVIGRLVKVNGVPNVVVGVMDDGFRFPMIADIWQPLGQKEGLDFESTQQRELQMFARLSEGGTVSTAQAEVATLSERLAAELPEGDETARPTVIPFTGSGSHPMFIALMGSVGFVLLIACTNVANMLLARNSGRCHEFAVRASLGATRWTILRQLMAESLLLSTVAGVLGLTIATVGVRVFADSTAGLNFPYWFRFEMDGRVFAFLAIVSLGTAVTFGLLPALHLLKINIQGSFNSGSSRANVSSGSVRRWTEALTVIDLALTMTLLAGASLMMKSFVAIYRADTVVDASEVLMLRVELPQNRYPSADSRTRLFADWQRRISGLAQVSSTTIASTIPFYIAPLRRITIPGRQPPGQTEEDRVALVSVSPGYFETLGVRATRGRVLVRLDGTPGHEHTVVNERFATRYFPGESPIGQRISIEHPDATPASDIEATIVGVVPSLRQRFFKGAEPAVYLPLKVDPPALGVLLVRAEQQASALTPALRDQMRQLDPDLPLHGIMPLDEHVNQTRWQYRVFSWIFTVFALVAVVLSAVGLYALGTHNVARRVKEIGVRMAFGATANSVASLFLRRAGVLLSIGAVIGLVGAVGIGTILESMLVDTQPVEPGLVIATTLFLFTVSLFAAFWPTRRATRLDPSRVLRDE